MSIDFLLEVFREHPGADAMVWRDRVYSYGWLLGAIDGWRRVFGGRRIGPGRVVSVEGDFTPNSVAALLALVDSGAIVVPMTSAYDVRKEALLALGEVEVRVVVSRESDEAAVEATGVAASHPLYAQLRAGGRPGLLLFTSGSTGTPKAALHDFSRLLGKFRRRRHSLRSLMFLMFDHIGGVDTLLYSLSNGSAVITCEDRSAEQVCRAIERYRVEVLPAAPSFLTMMLASGAASRYDLSSLRFITYGAEVMPTATLEKLARAFPGVTLQQKYGATEVGTLRSRSQGNDSLWVKVGGEGYQTRVVDGMLQVKAASSMLGYLNAPSPFTEDGWFVTGDLVEVNGEYVRFLGRQSDLINVGGDKVYPAQVEAAIEQIDNVLECSVYGEKHPLLGQIVCARVSLREPEEPRAAEGRIRREARRRLQAFQVPMKIAVSPGPVSNHRNKKNRRETVHAG